MPLYNEAINPKQESEEQAYSLTLTPCRAEEITKAQPLPKDADKRIGGQSNPKTGIVIVPTDDSAESRTIRLHEAMHIAHTLKTSRPHDLLDQALEDARLHRYCSKTSTSVYQQARRDELTIALKDLRIVARAKKLEPMASLLTLRSMAILKASSSILDSHQKLLSRVISRFGKSAERDFSNALIELSNCNGNTKSDEWQKARKPLLSYFDSEFGEDLPPMMSPESSKKPDFTYEEDDSDSKSSKPSESAEASEDAHDTSASHSDSKDLKDSEDSSDDSSDDSSESADDRRADSPIDPTDDKPSEDETKAKPSDKPWEDEDESEDLKPRTMAPMKGPKTIRESKKRIEAHPDEYTADLTPECDKETFKRMDESCHLKLMVRRLDMGINRVRLSLGRRAPMSVISGRSIVARKLASAMTTPGTRAMSRPTAKGGFGTILIDASGSMSIPEDALIRFLDTAPALTLAFYNAPADGASDAGYQGNIFIYAANGYRASCKTIAYGSIPHYGNGNLIDYQVLAWLIKQPAPRYIVTDIGFTGPWAFPASRLLNKLTKSKQVIHVHNLDAMKQIMREQENKR